MEHTCVEVQEHFLALVSRTLDPRTHVFVMGHLRACDACREELRLLTQIRQTVHSRLACGPGDAFVNRAWEGIRQQIVSDMTSSEPKPELTSLLNPLSGPIMITQRVLMLVRNTCVQSISNAIMSVKPVLQN